VHHCNKLKYEIYNLDKILIKLNDKGIEHNEPVRMIDCGMTADMARSATAL
jgi:hypothetical protein